MNKTILMIAFDFPPSNAASVQRTLKFFEYLNQLGWTTIMLTAKTEAYPLVDDGFTVPLKSNQHVYRATAWDVHKQLSYKGKHFSWMKTPDRWGSWIPFAIQQGKKIINQHNPDIIWSTFPIPSANIIAKSLAKYSGKPWIADYRDPAPYIHTTNGKWLDFIHKKIDDATFKHADKIVFATDASKKLYQTQYPCHEKFEVIENGYDETNFEKAAELSANHANIFVEDKFNLYYAGGLYPNGRDPRPIFKAIAKLRDNNIINDNNFKLTFQGAGDGSEFTTELNQLNLENLVDFITPTSFLLALVNMSRADALLLIQDSRFNLQIPGKIFEYFRTGKPLLIKTDKNGATAKLAEKSPLTSIVESENETYQALHSMVSKTENSETLIDVTHHSRELKSSMLNTLINQLYEERVK